MKSLLFSSRTNRVFNPDELVMSDFQYIVSTFDQLRTSTGTRKVFDTCAGTITTLSKFSKFRIQHNNLQDTKQQELVFERDLWRPPFVGRQ